jgi:hypothetical protein
MIISAKALSKSVMLAYRKAAAKLGAKASAEKPARRRQKANKSQLFGVALGVTAAWRRRIVTHKAERRKA